MSDENISIEISDGINPSVSKKLLDIADNAKTAHTGIETLKLALNQLGNLTPLAKLQSEVAKLNQAVLKNVEGANRLEASDARAAAAKQRLATEVQRTEAAISRANIAQNAAALSAEKLNIAATQAANASQRLATEEQRTATQAANAASALDRAAITSLRLAAAQERTAATAAAAADRINQQALKIEESLKREIALYGDVSRAATASYDLQHGALRNLNEEQKQSILGLAQRLDKLDDASAAFARNEQSVGRAGKAYQNFGNLARQTGFQLQDAVVQLQAGANAGLVFSQQGSQLLSVFHPLLGLAAALAGVLAGTFLSSLIDNGQAAKKMAEELKALIAEINNLDEASKKIVTKGIALSLEEETKAYEEQTKAINKQIEAIAKLNAENGKERTVTTGGVGGGGAGTMTFLVDNTKLLKVANDDLTRSQVAQVTQLEKIKKLNDPQGLKQKLEDIKKETELTDLQNKSTGVQSEAYYRLEGAQKGYKDGLLQEYIAARKIQDQNKERLKDNKTLETSLEKRETVLAKVNAQLDNESARLLQLQPLREQSAQFDKIEESLMGRKIKLSTEEENSIKSKISSIQSSIAVQRELDKLYQSVVQPLEQYNASLKAADLLYKQGAISLQQYKGALAGADELYKSSVDPLYQYNRQLDEELNLLKLLPKERQIESQILEISNQLLQSNIVLTNEQTNALREKLNVLQQANLVSQEESRLLDETIGKREQFKAQLEAINNLKSNPQSGFGSGDAAVSTSGILQGMGLETQNLQIQSEANVQIYRDMYTQIDDLRKANLISEQESANLRLQIWLKQQNAQLNTTKSMFSSLEGLSKSNNSKLASIGKAAAIARATIETYQAATGAYASLASIPYVGPALGAAAAAAAIAAGLANVAQIRAQPTGFETGGYTGNIGRQSVAGVVHGQEFVMNAQATQRIGVSKLEALQTGAASIQQGSAPQTKTSVKGESSKEQSEANKNEQAQIVIVNVDDESKLANWMQSSEGKTVFVNMLRENQDEIKQIGQN
jgi:hypothetical protein